MEREAKRMRREDGEEKMKKRRRGFQKYGSHRPKRGGGRLEVFTLMFSHLGLNRFGISSHHDL